MTTCEPLYVAALTAPGRGAVAVVALWGRTAARALAARFTPVSPRPLPDLPLGRIAFGRWRSHPDDVGEEVVVARLEDRRWELHCHGGTAAVESILAALERDGATRVSAETWLELLDDDPLRTAAVERLAHARTPLAAAHLAAQARGALRAALQSLHDHLLQGVAERSLAQIDLLLETATIGLHLTTPWRVALVGRPNAGKSSLINRLAGYERAIVADQPGTTRDVVTALVASHGWLFELADTAGLRTTSDAIEAAGVARAEAQRESADVVLLVADLAHPWTDDDVRLADATPQAIVVHNKCDLGPLTDDRPPGLCASARTGEGCDALWDAIVHRLIPTPPAPDEPLVFTRELAALLAAVRDDVVCGDFTSAAHRTQSAITRRVVPQTGPSASGSTEA